MTDKIVEIEKRKIYTDKFSLPSKGLIYEKENPFSSGEIEFRMFKMSEIMFTAGSKSEFDELIESVIQPCIVSPKEASLLDLDHNDLMAFLMKFRQFCIGDDYGFTVQCPKPSCKKEQPTRVMLKLSELPCESITEETLPPSPYVIELPLTKAKIELRRLNGYDKKDIKKEVSRRLNRDSELDRLAEMYKLTQVYHIKGIKKDTDPKFNYDLTDMEKERFIDELFGMDLITLTTAYDRFNFGLELKKTVMCNHCGDWFRTVVGLSEEFFRPRH